MTKADDQAYPLVDSAEGFYQGGLTKLEYFAAAAMQGLLAQHIKYNKKGGVVSGEVDYDSEPVYKSDFIATDEDDTEYLVRDAVHIANRLIEELNEQSK